MLNCTLLCSYCSFCTNDSSHISYFSVFFLHLYQHSEILFNIFALSTKFTIHNSFFNAYWPQKPDYPFPFISISHSENIRPFLNIIQIWTQHFFLLCLEMSFCHVSWSTFLFHTFEWDLSDCDDSSPTFLCQSERKPFKQHYSSSLTREEFHGYLWFRLSPVPSRRWGLCGVCVAVTNITSTNVGTLIFK